MTLARELVGALRAASQAPLPGDVALAARLHLLDACGVGLAAAGSPVGAAYRGFAKDVMRGGPGFDGVCACRGVLSWQVPAVLVRDSLM